MRRILWLGVGAVLGAAGYRKLDRAAKTLTGQLGTGQVTRRAVQVDQAHLPGASPGRSLASGQPAGGAQQTPVVPSQAVSAGLRTCAGLAFSLATGIVRRAGAYRARRAAGAGTGARAGGGGGERRPGIAAFLGDVRDGMDEYLDAHEHQVQARPRREIGSS